MKYRNFQMVPKVIFGRNSFDQLGEILMPQRRNSEAPFIFLVDDVLEQQQEFISRIPVMFQDRIIFINVEEEPKTDQVDAIVKMINEQYGEEPSGIIGIGGGSVMDLTKATALLLTNPGSASDYQGWDLVKRKGVYHVGIPTLSGTGAEVSRTAVLTGPEKKLGINSDYTPFDQVVLDPVLTRGVPKDQWFYTGMDCFIHCVESLEGHFINTFSESYGEKAYEMCTEVYTCQHMSESERQNKLMMASWHGGLSIAYSQVGVAHALSYGLSYELGIHHGVGNCIVFDHLEAYYPEGVQKFREMKEINEIALPKGVCSGLSEAQFDTMIGVALGMEPLWENALGEHWKEKIDEKKIRSLYEKM
ncbi:iron-containing alcohol dehydrogenase family protein [Robertkochia flava]|uniref:iron-containing alcohol dehydrogenase family protein n=1 Tax=Robertkochia flava TaxID=3447986 RepID=UPI001CCA44D4|nr:iron-containing alcohol dehydrogenase family protein [Robertkochia marina]